MIHHLEVSFLLHLSSSEHQGNEDNNNLKLNLLELHAPRYATRSVAKREEEELFLVPSEVLCLPWKLFYDGLTREEKFAGIAQLILCLCQLDDC